ncbi:orphan sodium- and chloride-dependent neurotransmitter transporter NTT5-like [Trichechus manatus latirostris]|uniref:Orphan sodium- and chloride-dependent neurotransmitter transporter NTT5-like n=1 Tax=Trichechus manatus latirostris TaxID=127582 RepID=A0A2Y9RET6_TRIMA|nr:orphan sodium- and chloride-dependent neurotransmitter transporter NTT5-like [Trichechus manatus latirostris]
MSLVLEDQNIKARAWETQAWEAQSRDRQHKKAPLSEMEAVSIPKHSTSALQVQVTKKKQNEDRTRLLWSNKAEYLLAQVGYSVASLNLLSFPNLWLQNGGCIFLIIYILVLFLIGVPLLFMEMASGQRLHEGSLGIWKHTSSWMNGLGYTSFMVCFIEGLVFSLVNCWSLLYLSQSFQFPVPWETCPLVKNSSGFDAECARTTPSMYFWYRKTLNASDTIEDGGLLITSVSLSLFLIWFLTGLIMINGCKSTGKALYVLVPLPYLIILCFLIRSPLLEGASFGLQYMLVFKEVSFPSPPSTLERHHSCLFLGPPFLTIHYLPLCPLPWMHLLFTLGLGLGIIASFATYMPSSNNCLADAFVVALVDLGTSLLATPVIFSVMGFWATVIAHRCSEKNVEILMNLVSLGKLPPEAQPPENVLGNNAASAFTSWFDSLPHSIKKMVLSKVSDCEIQNQLFKVKEGPRFAFLLFIEAMSFIPGSAYWSILFFLMYLSLGLTSMVGIMQGIITPLQDSFSFFRKHPKLLIVNVSVLMFLCSLFFARPSGYYYFRLLSDYWIILPIVLLTTFENVTIAWVYGAKRFLAEIMILMDRPISPIYRFLLCCLCPSVLLVLSAISLIYIYVQDFIYVAWDSSTVSLPPHSKEVSREFPSWALNFIIILGVIVFLPILIYFVYCLIHRILSSSMNWSHLLHSPNPKGQLRPSKDIHKREILQEGVRGEQQRMRGETAGKTEREAGQGASLAPVEA